MRSSFCHIMGKSGISYPGVRIENISYPLTIPAAQAAVCSCLGNDDTPVAIIEPDSPHSDSAFWREKFSLRELKAIPKDASLFNPLIKKIDSVKQKLIALCEFTVSDESDFPVTALLKTTEGYIPGVNVELEEWNLGLCAERVAIARALASGYFDFSEMHIYAPKSDFISPCGACRQVLFELMPDQLIALHHDGDSVSKHFVSHLLPNGFISSSLKK